MKKFLLGALVLVSAFGFTSCKKDYNCVCRFNGVQVFSQKYEDISRSDANAKCNDNDNGTGQAWDCDIE
ncbi:MAG: hypothetical protein JNL72_09465 [Flavipsychrobacter sp.]|nr:hypothetical protein [Flavipsychrobacter sp.]